jgi:glucose-1-phosphate adenylyltransferase
MGIYLFNTSILRWYLEEDTRKKSSHDFGRDILPQMVADRPVFAYPFEDPKSHAQHYWRDIGTLDAYWEANMDLITVNPPFNLYDHSWPLRTYQGQFPPAKFVFADSPDTKNGRIGHALDSIVSGGCIVSGSRVQNCVLSPAVHVDNYAEVRDSILMENVIVGKRAKIKRAIIDKDVTIPPGTHIGYDLKADAERFTVTESGLVAISKGMKLK